VTASGGVWLAVHATRDKERKAMEAELNAERAARLESELRSYQLSLKLAEHGINPDE
jgi:hypothetical protein